MKTIEEINEIAPYHPLEWQEGYGIWQAGFMEGQMSGAAELVAIDNAELAEVRKQRDAYYDELLKLRVKKLEWIDKACEFFAAYLAEIGYPDDWCRDSEVQKSGEQRFREFMEE